MLCPYCGYDESNVCESRDAKEGHATRRRRECVKCRKRFTTYEEVANIELRVVKKDGRVEDYKREKLEKCIDKASWKMTDEQKARILDEIEMKLLNYSSVEIPSKEIGNIIMEKLREVDELAYIRFATVYLDLKDINDFEKLIINYKNNQKNKSAVAL